MTRCRLASLPALLAALLAALTLASAACAGAATSARTTTSTATTTAATTAAEARDATVAASPAPSSAGATPAVPPTAVTTGADVDRALAHVRALAGAIGTRAAGTEAERAAARYVAAVLRDEGYDTTIEPFTFQARFDDSRVTWADAVTLADVILEAVLLDGSALGSASGILVEAGTGQPAEIAAADVRDRVVLERRGVIPFAQKVANARAAGAIAVIIVNNEPGPYGGTLGAARAEVPVVAVEGERWETLRAQTGRRVTVTADGGSRPATSQNVVGRRGEQCRGYLGAHYDSVPQGPGANDNASGTAVALELARAHPADGLCVVAFGAEEVGLFGSQAFVAQHPTAGVRFLLNFDMAGHLDTPIIVGDEVLTAAILATLDRDADPPLKAGTFPPFASSDHVSFVAAGVPAVTITAGDDAAIHSARDDVAHVQREALAAILRAGDSILEGLSAALRTPRP